MVNPENEFDFVKAKTSTLPEQIEIAYNLIGTINFQKVVDNLVDTSKPEVIYLSFGKINLINESMASQLKRNEFVFKYFYDWPDPKLGLQTNLGNIARGLFRYSSMINDIRKGKTIGLESVLLGTIWANSETLIKYREILLNFGKPHPETKIKEQPKTDLISNQLDASISKKDYYTEICHAFNCNSFFDFLNKQTDLEELGRNLEEQLRRYARSCGEGFEKGIGDLYSAGFYSREQWLKHTIFICKDEYNRTKKEIFNEAAKWCEDWHEKYLFQFNPYSPEEQAKMNKIWDIPLWEQLKNREQPKVQTNQETNSEKIARILEPIRRAFDTPDHLDSIVNALVQYSSDGMPPPKVNSKVIQFEIAKFYPFFKQVKNETGLTNKGIATVLTYFICKPNGSPILLSTIEKNIKQRY